MLRRHQLLRSPALRCDRALEAQLVLRASRADRRSSLIVVRLLLVQALPVLGLRVFNAAALQVSESGLDQLGDSLQLRRLRTARDPTWHMLLLRHALGMPALSGRLVLLLVEALSQRIVAALHLLG